MMTADAASADLGVYNPPTRERALEVKPRPRLFRALGGAEPPSHIEIDGACYRLEEVFKHDSWAATAVYAGEGDRVVCKFNRQQSLFGFPMKWLGRRLAERENHALQVLADVAGIPERRGHVLYNGQPQRHVVAHRYVDGHPLSYGERVDDDFFPALLATLDALHRRGLAYVDLHKSENIVVGDDSRPYLVDFQVCYIPSRLRWLASLLRGCQRALQRMDHYHVYKHVLGSRPDLAATTLADYGRRSGRPWWIRVHRLVAVPLRGMRRRLLTVLGVRSGRGMAESEFFPEMGKRAP
jgi:hypothetical protein